MKRLSILIFGITLLAASSPAFSPSISLSSTDCWASVDSIVKVYLNRHDNRRAIDAYVQEARTKMRCIDTGEAIKGNFTEAARRDNTDVVRLAAAEDYAHAGDLLLDRPRNQHDRGEAATYLRASSALLRTLLAPPRDSLFSDYDEATAYLNVNTDKLKSIASTP